MSNLLLDLLGDLIDKCCQCNVCKNGKAIPFIGNSPKAIILGEAPGKTEIVEGTPFVGKSGKYLIETLEDNGLTRDDFIIVNTIQCRPVKETVSGETNGKPTKKEMLACMGFVSSYLFDTGLDNILCLGNYPKYWLDIYTGVPKPKLGGISSVVGNVLTISNKLSEDISKQFTLCFHPASVVYDVSKKFMFEDVISNFCKSLKD